MWLCVLSTALCSSRQTWETSSLDSGAHQWWQSEPYRGRSRPALQTLPAADGSAFQTGTSHTCQAPHKRTICPSDLSFFLISVSVHSKGHKVTRTDKNKKILQKRTFGLWTFCLLCKRPEGTLVKMPEFSWSQQLFHDLYITSMFSLSHRM